MRIVVTGTRGIPDIQGGVETHCENLFPRLAEKGHHITILRRDCYVPAGDRLTSWKGVELVDIRTPRYKSFEAIIHTWRSVWYAKRAKADIIHIHAIGPALLTPLARMLGMKVVMTHHGPDYDRDKWGFLAKAMLRLGERLGARYSHRVIVISKVIENLLHRKYGDVPTRLIYNGVETPQLASETDYISSLGLEKGKYVVAIGRFVKEKNFHHLIESFAKAAPEGFRLAIAGDADHPDSYSQKLRRLAEENGVVLTGFIKGRKLNQLMSHARLFCLPSSHEGLPIALLEAMSYQLDVAVSDIPANRIPELEESDFFPVGDIDALSRLISRKLESGNEKRSYDLSSYDWDNIADATDALYREL